MRGLGLGLGRWTTLEVCWVLGERIQYRMHGLELCGVMKGVDGRSDVSVLGWFGHVENEGNDTIAKRVYEGECTGRHTLGQPRKRWSI